MPTTNYIWDPETDSCLMETDESGATTAAYTNEPAPFGPLISQRRDGETSYYHYDALGSTRQLTDASETMVNTNLYDAWGVNVDSTGSIPNPFQWVGEPGYYRDAEIDQFAVRHRSYSPSIARWTAKDPIAFILDGVLAGSGDAQQFAYVLNRPMNAIDPSGLRPFTRFDIVAKSFINGLPLIGRITPPWRIGSPFTPHWVVVPPGIPIGTATQRLNVLAGIVRHLPAFNQNPFTDAKDGKYRLYTRAFVTVDCRCPDDRITIVSIQTDMDGGVEIWPIRGTINMNLASTRISDRCYEIVWTGWGSPNSDLEWGLQWVALRTSVNIWHKPKIRLCCLDGGAVSVNVTRFHVSRFPSHRLWINGGFPVVDIPQHAFADLWNPLPGRPDFVDD